MAETETVSCEEAPLSNDCDPDYLKDVIKKKDTVKAQFLEIIGGEPKLISHRPVHAKAKLRANGDLGIFYRYFICKYVSIRLKQDAKSGTLDDYASIFPFQTKAADVLDVSEMPPLDDSFSSEIAEFVGQHFGTDCDVDGLKNLLWANIEDFKKTHFPDPPSLEQLVQLIQVGSPSSSGENAVLFPVNDHLKSMVHLNRGGTFWYCNFQSKFNEACAAYEKKELVIPDKRIYYYRFLPEINCCELLLLLETKFYEMERQKYVHLFQKYLFFFKNARDHPQHPVCFIDDTLFACLQFRREYQTFREEKSIYDCLWELCMMTLVHCRKYRLDSKQKLTLKPDQSDLQQVVTYADGLLEGVQSVNVHYGEPQFQRFNIFMLLDDTAFLIHYSGRKGPEGSDWIGQMVKCAFLSPEIKKLKFYNAYLGEETVYEMPRQKEEIRSFVQQLMETESNANRVEPSYPLRFLMQPDLKKYFAKLPEIPSRSGK